MSFVDFVNLGHLWHLGELQQKAMWGGLPRPTFRIRHYIFLRTLWLLTGNAIGGFALFEDETNKPEAEITTQ